MIPGHHRRLLTQNRGDTREGGWREPWNRNAGESSRKSAVREGVSCLGTCRGNGKDLAVAGSVEKILSKKGTGEMGSRRE